MLKLHAVLNNISSDIAQSEELWFSNPPLYREFVPACVRYVIIELKPMTLNWLVTETRSWYVNTIRVAGITWLFSEA